MAIATERVELEPILFEIVEGALESARRQMEAQVDRTARSTIVREQHDHRAGIFDRQGQSVTALSFASTPTPIIKRFEGNTDEGDIFIFNDCYKSDGGITHLPDICITVPVFVAGDVVGYVQVFGNVNDIGGDSGRRPGKRAGFHRREHVAGNEAARGFGAARVVDDRQTPAARGVEQPMP